MGVRSCLAICVLVFAFCISMAKAGDSGAYDWIIPARSGESCKGSIAECMAEEEEFALDSESNRRILATKKYISYGALQKNSVPCSRRGASYYNCKPGAQANPYSRGCSAITRCRS
ncbi:rapid alkalinization factor [Lycium barbarum]|uniref:rapid alkalinization factor n=1 Tax=Lycium barbarum TaxID=112863 RepID=UPI00293EB050|nr:rapid alkalinization factor [Lycium barbarum]